MPNKKTPTKASAKVSKPTKGTTKKVNKTTKPKSHKKDLVFASGPLAFWGADGQILLAEPHQSQPGRNTRSPA